MSDAANRLAFYAMLGASLSGCPACGEPLDSDEHHAECIAPLDQIEED